MSKVLAKAIFKKPVLESIQITLTVDQAIDLFTLLGPMEMSEVRRILPICTDDVQRRVNDSLFEIYDSLSNLLREVDA